MTVERTARLRFHEGAVASETHVNLSAIHTEGRHLWIAGDETATVERLTCRDPEHPVEYADHQTFHLADLVRLPGETEDEVDVEGMALSDGYLWVVGSHSAKRKKLKRHHDAKKSAKRLATVSPEPARRVLARLAVDDDVPARRTGDGRRSLALGGPSLYDLLADDPHLAAFRDIPGKDNGLDIEGIAVYGEPAAPRVFLGLRGPVLRGWATVLQVGPREDGDALALSELADDAPYAKHFLDLDGLGIRDLCEYGADLLILAGPSMDLDGPVRVYRWPGAARRRSEERAEESNATSGAGAARRRSEERAEESNATSGTGGAGANATRQTGAAGLEEPGVVHRDELERVVDLPYGEGDDHAEGIALLPDGRLLVVYDSPASARLTEPGTVIADVVRLP